MKEAPGDIRNGLYGIVSSIISWIHNWYYETPELIWIHKVIQTNSVYPVLTLYHVSQHNHCYNWCHAYVLKIGDVTQCILLYLSKKTILYSPLWLKFNGKSSSFMTLLSTRSWHVDVIMATDFSAGQPIREQQSKELLSDWLTRCLHVSGLKMFN